MHDPFVGSYADSRSHCRHIQVSTPSFRLCWSRDRLERTQVNINIRKVKELILKRKTSADAVKSITLSLQAKLMLVLSIAIAMDYHRIDEVNDRGSLIMREW